MGRIAIPQCRVCGESMIFSRRSAHPLRRHYQCDLCGSWVSLLTKSGTEYMSRWRRESYW